MVDASIAEMHSRKFHVTMFDSSPWPVPLIFDKTPSLERYYYRGNQFQLYRVLKRRGAFEKVALIGADVLDGHYNPVSVANRINLLGALAKQGSNARIIGASCSSRQFHPLTQAAIHQLPATVPIFARDPRSVKRFQGVFPERVIEASADIAFLVQPDANHVDVKKFLEWRSKNSGPLIAININSIHIERIPHLYDRYLALSKFLVNIGKLIVFIPHDCRGSRSDISICQQMINDLNTQEYLRSFLFESPSPNAIKAVLSQMDALFTGRLHAQILAMGNGVPCFGLSYADKYEGVLDLFKLPVSEHLATPEEFFSDYDGVLEKFINMLSDTESLRGKIRNALPDIRALAIRNFTY